MSLVRFLFRAALTRPLRLVTALVAAVMCLAVTAAGPPAFAAVPQQPEGVWPLEPRPEVVTGFHPPAQRWLSGHRGVDLLGRPGQRVRAAMAGTVSYAGLLAGRGVVVVDHGEVRTTYQPVAASLSVGDAVQRGQPIGTLRSFGSHCWPRSCLHWGLIRGDTYLNPLSLVGAMPVRLLPLFSGSVPSAPGWPPYAAGGLPDFAVPWQPTGSASRLAPLWTPLLTPGTAAPSTAARGTAARGSATPWTVFKRPGGELAGRPSTVGLW